MDARLGAVKILWKLLKWATALVVLELDAVGIGGGEDIQADRKRGVAYLALLNRDSVHRDLGRIHCRPLAR